jgi:ElaB/YqjD/DUF883 family membrane-anchored ribosome-binding protein
MHELSAQTTTLVRQELELAKLELSGKGKRPERLREEIEHTRAELGDTVAALAEKTDVKGQAQHAAGAARESVAGTFSEIKQKLTGAKGDLVSAAQEATPESAGNAGQCAKAFARENPLPLVAVGAFALGWLTGSRTR